ncbi:MAG: hypothetical protein ACR2N4_11065 [Jatrophihabitans sp.]
MPAIGGAASVRAVRAGLGEAIEAARGGDAERFAAANAVLAGLDQQRLSILQGAIVRELLELTHPDGLTGEDAQLVLTRCVRAALAWYPDTDAEAMITVLMGALGAGDPAELPPVGQTAALAHGNLLIADLLAGRPEPGVALAPLLQRALAEIERAETIELP